MKCVIVSCFGYYDIRLKYVEEAFLNNGYDVDILISDFDHIHKEYISHNISKSVHMLHVPEYKKNISLRRILSHIVFCRVVYKKLLQIKPDILYVLVPPNLICKQAIKYKNITGNKVIFDLIDMWPESFPIKYFKNTLLKSWKNMRNHYIKDADYVILECDYYKKIIDKCIREESQKVIYICKSDIKIRKCEIQELDYNQNINLCYLGSINSIIDIDSILEILVMLNDKKPVFLHIIGDGERRKEFEQRLQAENIKYRYYGKIFDEMKLNDVLSRCEYGINIYKAQTAIGLTMKSIDYFRFGIPIISKNITDTGVLIGKYKSGFQIENDNLTDIVDRMMEMKFEEWKQMCNNVNNMYEKEFSTEVCVEKISKIVQDLQMN